MDRYTNRWISLCTVLLLAVATSGCAYFSDRFDRNRGDEADAAPPTAASSDAAAPPAAVETQNTVPQTAAAQPAPDQTPSGGTGSESQTSTPSVAAVQSDTPESSGSMPAASAAGLNIDRPEDVIEMQRRLKLLGFNPGPVDGVAGPQTLLALARFRDMAGPLGNPSLRQIIDNVVSANERGESSKPWWQRRLPADEAIAGTAATPNSPSEPLDAKAGVWPSDETISAQTAAQPAAAQPQATAADTLPSSAGMTATHSDQDVATAKLAQPADSESKDGGAPDVTVESIDLSALPKQTQVGDEAPDVDAAPKPSFGQRVKNAWQATRNKVSGGVSKLRRDNQADEQSTAVVEDAIAVSPESATQTQ